MEAREQDKEATRLYGQGHFAESLALVEKLVAANYPPSFMLMGFIHEFRDDAPIDLALARKSYMQALNRLGDARIDTHLCRVAPRAMALSSSRKHLNTALGLLLMGGLVYLFWPFVVGRGQMQQFWASLPAGASLAQVQGLASERGYRVSSLMDGQAFVHEPRSMGRFNCVLRFGQDGLASAPYADND